MKAEKDLNEKTTIERIEKVSVKKAIWVIFLFILFILGYFYIAYPIRQWQCEQYGMQASHLVKGCVIKEVKE